MCTIIYVLTSILLFNKAAIKIGNAPPNKIEPKKFPVKTFNMYSLFLSPYRVTI